MVRTSSFEVAEISCEVAPIWVVVAAISAGGRLLLLGGGGDLGDRGVDLDARLLHLADQPHELVGHPVEAVGELAEFVPALDLHALREIALAHHVHDLREVPERPADRADEVSAARPRR